MVIRMMIRMMIRMVIRMMIRMVIRMVRADPVEKAIPRWAPPICFPSAIAPPRNRLKPIEVVPTRLENSIWF